MNDLVKARLPLLLCLLTAIPAFADIVILKDTAASQVSGVIDSGTADEVRIQNGTSRETISLDRIQSIQFEPAPPAAPPPAAAVMNTLPAGTEIAVRTIEAINSKTADKSKEYSASLDDPIVVEGVTIADANASAILRVTDVQSAGFSRRASLSITLVAVVINGHRINVETGKVDSQSGSQAKRTATGAGVGAAAGAGVGAAAGGAIGAGIGAGVGAAAGAVAGKVFGKTVDIRPETRFTYQLTQPVNLPEASR